MEKQQVLREGGRGMATTTNTPAFVTQAFSWGYQDAQAAQARRGWAYWALGDHRQQEYADGYQAGLDADGCILIVS